MSEVLSFYWHGKLFSSWLGEIIIPVIVPLVLANTLQEAVIGGDLSLQFHLEVQQSLIVSGLAFHLCAHLPQLPLQLQNSTVVPADFLTVASFRLVQRVLQRSDLRAERLTLSFLGWTCAVCTDDLCNACTMLCSVCRSISRACFCLRSSFSSVLPVCRASVF